MIPARRAALAAVVVVLLGSTSVPRIGSAALASATSLPATRLEFGLSNLDSTWMTSSGVPWRYRYQYLAGGVNTSGNWLTWQDLSLPPGQFALDYMRSSTTAPANYIPVFTWYQLLQSTPHVGSSELDRDYSNLNNASTMSSYYASFKILMQKAGQYGGLVVVHVEPDFWGYMQQKAGGGDATTVAASVSSSGFAEASAFPDNLVGFASELRYLRDTYAPNAMLAMHASMWASSIDIGSDTDPNVNPTIEADKTAAFLVSAGAAGWDATFNDVYDHDAAWWELASCGSPPCVNQYFTHWWDPNNIVFPNFHRYEAWVSELHMKIGKPQIVWQVPVGNQYYLTMNNTCGHYQDNLAQYFIGHAGELFNAGLIAVLFGKGNDCQTSNEDVMKDGITNSGAATSDPLGGCNACNVHVSQWSDDDGGYLRVFVGLYYAGQSACASANVTAAPPSPQVQGVQVLLTSTATGCSSPQFEYWLQSPGGAWTQLRPYSATATLTWNTTGYPAGTYVIHAWASQAGSDLSTWQTYGSSTYTLQAQPQCANAAVSPASLSQPAGTTVAFTVSSSGCLNPLYEFWVQYPDGTWNLKRGWGSSNAFSWDTSGLAPGMYLLHAWVSYSGSTWEVIGSANVTLTGCTSAAVSPASQSLGSGSVVSLSASSGGCPNPVYEFWVQYPDGSWHLVQGWGGASLSWDTTGLGPGVYTVHAWANQQGAAPTLEVYGTATVSLSGCATGGLSPGTVSQAAGTVVALTASSSGCPKPQYEYWVQYPDGSWRLKQGWSSSTAFSWATTGLGPGTYTVHAWVSATGSGHDAIGSSTVTLTGCSSASVMPSSGSSPVGTSVTFTASSSGCPTPVYEFWLLDPSGTWHLMRPFSATSTWTWDTSGWAKGNYTVHVWANNQGADSSIYEIWGSATASLD